MAAQTPVLDRLLRVRGTVQGVGFRPFVLHLAHELGVQGWVRNDAQGVLIRTIGAASLLEQFAAAITRRAPPASRVSGVEWLEPSPAEPAAERGFAIIESGSATGEIETNAPVDLIPCADCRHELLNPSDRRHGYPFINCTQCGPRYTIIEHLPYDRPQTTMACFRFCPACEREYGDSSDRRFHAEPNACPVCGPHLQLTDSSGHVLMERDAALAETTTALRQGLIVAVKGVGGFHLMVDATNEAAVVLLRRRKHREEKPFAVMFRDLATLRQSAEVSDDAATLLTSPQGPIVLVARRTPSVLADGVAPGNPWVGALLPSSPLHLLLMAQVDRPLIATSANLTDEPLCTDNDEARQRLKGIADLFLAHNRAIARPVDDSVMRFTPGHAPIVLRRARGYAPAPLTLPANLPHPIVCVGAQMKNTIAVASGRRLVLSPHIGDLGGIATHRVFTRTIETLSALLAAQPAAVVCDQHPDYNSTLYADSCGLPRIAVQHHLAHVLAVLLEHQQSADDVLGISWDGTGYGNDGTVWGGEFILLRNGRATRFARLRPFQLPGSEAAVRDARRVAMALAAVGAPDHYDALAQRLGFKASGAKTLRLMIERKFNSPFCTSAGRLFDGFGALLGLGAQNTFEGQVPLAVETAATGASLQGDRLRFALRPADAGATWEIDWAPALAPLFEQPTVDAPQAAAAFHRGLANVMAETCALAGVKTVVLAGGCFQNALLHHFAATQLTAAGFKVLAARELPPNDGAIAAGQALGALWNLTTVEAPANLKPTPTP